MSADNLLGGHPLTPLSCGGCHGNQASLSPLTDKAYSDGDRQGSSSDSEDELMGQYQEAVSRSQGLRGRSTAPAATHVGGFTWESRQKYSRQKYSPLTADYDGYSSDASADAGKARGVE